MLAGLGRGFGARAAVGGLPTWAGGLQWVTGLRPEQLPTVGMNLSCGCTGIKEAKKHPDKQSVEWPCWFKSACLGLSQGDKCRDRAESIQKAQNQESATLP